MEHTSSACPSIYDGRVDQQWMNSQEEDEDDDEHGWGQDEDEAPKEWDGGGVDAHVNRDSQHVIDRVQHADARVQATFTQPHAHAHGRQAAMGENTHAHMQCDYTVN